MTGGSSSGTWTFENPGVLGGDIVCHAEAIGCFSLRSGTSIAIVDGKLILLDFSALMHFIESTVKPDTGEMFHDSTVDPDADVAPEQN
jgi:hypothetical protein